MKSSYHPSKNTFLYGFVQLLPPLPGHTVKIPNILSDLFVPDTQSLLTRTPARGYTITALFMGNEVLPRLFAETAITG